MKVRVFEADYTQPDPDGKIAEHLVKARRADESESVDFYIVDPTNGEELGAYSGRNASGVEGKDYFY